MPVFLSEITYDDSAPIPWVVVVIATATAVAVLLGIAKWNSTVAKTLAITLVGCIALMFLAGVVLSALAD